MTEIPGNAASEQTTRWYDDNSDSDDNDADSLYDDDIDSIDQGSSDQPPQVTPTPHPSPSPSPRPIQPKNPHVSRADAKLLELRQRGLIGDPPKPKARRSTAVIR